MALETTAAIAAFIVILSVLGVVYYGLIVSSKSAALEGTGPVRKEVHQEDEVRLFVIDIDDRFNRPASHDIPLYRPCQSLLRGVEMLQAECRQQGGGGKRLQQLAAAMRHSKGLTATQRAILRMKRSGQDLYRTLVTC
jgi:hypothetical protein